MKRWMLALFASLAVACAGGEGDDPPADAPIGGSPDAPQGGVPDAAGVDAGTPDAASTPDAATTPSGFGQLCNTTTPCPQSAPVCVQRAAGVDGSCTLICQSRFMFRTNAAGQLTTLPGGGADNTCITAYGSGVGIAGCYGVLSNTLIPAAPGGLAGNTDYTGDMSCAIRCGAAGACPTGMQCMQEYCQR
jgi:hypothetical protein